LDIPDTANFTEGPVISADMDLGYIGPDAPPVTIPVTFSFLRNGVRIERESHKIIELTGEDNLVAHVK
jgi:hypothetical protein